MIEHNNFGLIHNYNRHRIEYFDLHEICQGCPEVGKIRLDGNSIENYRFGGPPLFWDNAVFLPLYYKKDGFQPCLIDLQTTQIKIYPKHFGLVLLKSANSEKMEFFEDLHNTSLITVSIEQFVDESPIKNRKGCARFLSRYN